MNTTAASFADFRTMLRRNFRHTRRNPTAVINTVIVPIFMMLLFVYVFGDAFTVGVDYVDYVTPGLIVMTIAYGVSATSIAANSDMSTGIINRFRVMDVARGAVLTAHVIENMVRSLVAIGFIIGLALLLGFRPSASLWEWLAVFGLVVLAVFAIGWLTVAFGIAAKTPESAGVVIVPLMLLPFLSSAIVPAEMMGPGVREFAEYQPFTPIIETLRGLLMGTAPAGSAIAAVAWLVGLALVGYLWARATFNKRA